MRASCPLCTKQRRRLHGSPSKAPPSWIPERRTRPPPSARSRSRLSARSARPAGCCGDAGAYGTVSAPWRLPFTRDWAVSRARPSGYHLFATKAHHRRGVTPPVVDGPPLGSCRTRRCSAARRRNSNRASPARNPCPTSWIPRAWRWFSLSDAASTSAEAAVLPFTSKTSGFSVVVARGGLYALPLLRRSSQWCRSSRTGWRYPPTA